MIKCRLILFFEGKHDFLNVVEVFAMMAASLVSLLEGVCALFSGMFGCVTGTTTSVENAGLVALTKVGSRRVIQISADFMIFFSIFGSS
ncbi:hypothetical protein P8452_53053 [Trifolium repens]|nr:hypothetical protein P8452_53053 [Trifolium repens]